MRRVLTAIVLSLLLAAPMEALARQRQGGGGGERRLSFPSQGRARSGWGGGRGGHGGHHHRHSHHGSDFFFFGGSFGPYWYPGWGWPYRPYYPYYAYYYPYWGYPYPYYPPVPYRTEVYDDRDVREESAPPADEQPASYGLIRLDGVPDGAAVELDGRFWLTADDLDDRWMALPQGEHRIAVTVGDAEPLVRTIRIVPGRTHVLKFDARARRNT